MTDGHSARFVPGILIALLLLQLLLVVASWLINAMLPHTHIRSLLSGEGIRWLFAHAVDNQLSPLLPWLMMVSMACGAVRFLLRLPVGLRLVDHPGRVTVAVLLFPVAALLLLTCTPHALLLGVDGALFPGSFARAVVPVSAFLVLAAAVVYGLLCGRLRTLAETFQMVVSGLYTLVPWIPVYMAGIQLWESIRFVFLMV